MPLYGLGWNSVLIGAGIWQQTNANPDMHDEIVLEIGARKLETLESFYGTVFLERVSWVSWNVTRHLHNNKCIIFVVLST